MNPEIRGQFPSLSKQFNGKPCVYLDGPAGTQVPNSVIKIISNYYKNHNANSGGSFITSLESDAQMEQVRRKIAYFLGAPGPECISLGPNMTSLNYNLSQAIGAYLNPGDEIVITQIDHESNRAPWIHLQSKGIIIRELRMNSSGQWDMAHAKQIINSKTKLIACGLASNMNGEVHPVKAMRKLATVFGAWLLLDAVHYAAHFKIDVVDLDCDFLLCSAYKFYGPHVGILYSRKGLLDRLPTYRLRTAYQHAPYKIETGTPNFAAYAGVKTAIEFIEDVGKKENATKGGHPLTMGWDIIKKHEKKLAKKLYNFLWSDLNVTVIGSAFGRKERAPTISFYHKKLPASAICNALAQENIFAWSGHFYALRSIEVLDLVKHGGVTRIGISMYTNEEDIAKTINALKAIF
ncbi:MAG: cysteine desulfurase-like protein [Bacteroidota bacterium]